MATLRVAKIILLLLVSGAAGLMLQIGWTRQLRLIFGGTTGASSAVLAIFLGGLGIGQWFWGKRIDHWKLPLRGYGWLEVGVAIVALCSPLLIALVQRIYMATGGEQVLGYSLATLLRLLLATIVLGGATCLMGGTMPAAAAALTTAGDRKRKWIGWLYASNTLGAVVGAALANFLLLETFGIQFTLWIGAACGLTAGLLAIRFPGVAIAEELAVENVDDPTAAAKKSSQAEVSIDSRLLAAASFVSGATFFVMEIVWYRMLAPLLGGSTFTFGTILAMALLGIGVGGALYGAVVAWRSPRPWWLALTFALSALLMIVPYAMGDRLALLAAKDRIHVDSFRELVIHWIVIASVVVLPASLISGFQFPLMTSLAGQGRSKLGAQLGWLYGCNSCGAILGSLMGGFVLLPQLLATGLWQGVTVVLIVSSLWLLWGTADRRLWLAQISVSLLGVLAVVGVWQQGPTVIWRHGSIGAGRIGGSVNSLNNMQDWVMDGRRQLVWETDGIESCMGIRVNDSPSFYINGKSDGNAYNDSGTQVGLALIGAALHPQAKNACVIGLGTGETAGWLASVGSIEKVDVFELERVVVQMADRCRIYNRNALDNPKLKIHFGDARESLMYTSQRYDLIVSEPSNPYRSGVAALLTREFFQSASEKMQPEGLFLQWLQAYEVEEETIASLLKTMREVFPDVAVWTTQSNDFVLICRKESSPRWSLESLQNAFKDEAIRDGLLKTARIHDAPGLMSRYVCGTKSVDAFIKKNDVPVSTDDCTWLEYGFARSVGEYHEPVSPILRKLAHQAGEPELTVIGAVDPEVMQDRRDAWEGWALEELDLINASADRLARREALDAFGRHEYPEALQAWQLQSRPPQCPIEHYLVALGNAKAGIDPSPESLEVLKEISPCEVAALLSIASLYRDDPDTLVRLAAVGAAAQLDPWPSSEVMEVWFAAVEEALPNLQDALASSNGQVGETLLNPFAGVRHDWERKHLRLSLAQLVDSPTLATVYEELEPTVPWQKSLLKQRVDLYRETKSPLLEAAESDFERFERMEANPEPNFWRLWEIR